MAIGKIQYCTFRIVFRTLVFVVLLTSFASTAVVGSTDPFPAISLTPAATLPGKYLLAFHACDTSAKDCKQIPNKYTYRHILTMVSHGHFSQILRLFRAVYPMLSGEGIRSIYILPFREKSHAIIYLQERN